MPTSTSWPDNSGITPEMITVIAGGVGAARLLRALSSVADPADISAIVNVGDDLELGGLHISPDLDTVTYTLAGAIDPERGWGLIDESWRAMEALDRFGGPTWFSLGDRDLGTHLYRTQRMNEGAALSTVTAEIASAWGLRHRLMPVTDDHLRTMVTVVDEGEIPFQEYFVGRQHSVPVAAVRFDGAEGASPAPGVVESIASADLVVIAPSNPIVSIAPVLAVPGVRDAIAARRPDVVAVSPIVGGAALKGPADRMLRELGHDASALGVARLLVDLVGTFVIDTVDHALAPDIEALDLGCVVTDTIMRDPAVATALATTIMGAVVR